MADHSSWPTSPKATEGSGLTVKDEVVFLHVTGTPGLVTISWFPLMLIVVCFHSVIFQLNNNPQPSDQLIL